MDDHDIYDPQELGPRRQIAAARHQRESGRLAMLAQRADSRRRADELKRWVGVYTRPVGDDAHSELRRMVEWAASQLMILNAS